MEVTIKDVAKATNLAMSTISKYINGGNVKPKNCAIIKEAIERLGYRPNVLARGLRTSKVYTVGILIPALSDPFVVKIINIIEQKLRKNGYLPLLCCHRDRYENAIAAVSFLMDKGVDGIILAPFSTVKDYVKPIVDAKIPLVVIDSVINKYDLDYVLVDNSKGAYEAVEDLVSKGHTKIAIITGINGWYTSDQRLRGYKRVFEDYNMKVDNKYIIEGNYTYECGYEAIRKLWNIDERPTAVFVSNYHMCIGAVKAIHDLAINIPEQLSVVMFDDMEFSIATNPNLSSVAQPLEEIGRKAAMLILKRMNEDYSDYPELIRLKTKYVSRDSVCRINKKRT